MRAGGGRTDVLFAARRRGALHDNRQGAAQGNKREMAIMGVVVQQNFCSFLQNQERHKMTQLDFDDEIQNDRIYDGAQLKSAQLGETIFVGNAFTVNSYEPVFALDAQGTINAGSLSDTLIEDIYNKLAKRLYNTPVLIHCGYCKEWAAVGTRCGGCGAMVGQ